MEPMKNIQPIDRFLRLMLGVVFSLLGYFWLANPWNWLGYLVAIVMFGTAVFRFCPIYNLFGMKPAAITKPVGPVGLLLTLMTLVTLVAGGSYGSAFFTRKFFLEDFNAMNHFYKQTLFLTGKEQRADAIANLNQLKPAFAAFTAKYNAYRPYAIKGDAKLTGDFTSVGKILSDVEPLIRSGDLHQAHLDLEKVRPIFQDVFKRNGFSMMSVALVDFHDAMELILTAATSKDAPKITSLYPEVSEKLKVIEADANDDEIKAIRSALEDVFATAQSPQLHSLPQKGDLLKSNFVKVYLKRG
jgi:hypothetical protein